MTSNRFPLRRRAASAAAFVLLAGAAPLGQAQAPVQPEPPPAATMPPPGAQPDAAKASAEGGAGKGGGTAVEGGPLAAFAWLSGCWQGTVNQREFREQWLPLRGGMLVGAGQQAMRGQMQDYEYLRLEARTDGIYFSQFSGDRKETSFKLAGTTTEEKDTIFTFANTADAFPERLVYRRGIDGWLYETIEGRLAGAEKKVIYPLRRIDCESGELILK